MFIFQSARAILLGCVLFSPIAVAEIERPTLLEIPLTGEITIRMRWIAPGNFIMGSPADELGRVANENQVEVTLTKGFYLAETELTQEQWSAVKSSNPSAFRGENLPVETITWQDAYDFTQAMQKHVKDITTIPAGAKFSLPTEAQWEYACRAGSTTALYNGKELSTTELEICPLLDEIAWYGGNAKGRTQPVATRKPNAWGLYDMHGNVWEWCLDNYSEKLIGGEDPWFRNESQQHVRRSGSATYYAQTCRAASRNELGPTAKGNGLGMRLALILPD